MKRVRKIVIVGGGTSGFMTASTLLKQFEHEIDLTLVEDLSQNTIGVGESTTNFFNNFLQFLELEDKEWMPESDAIYKLSIDFTNFDGKGSRVKFPFGKVDRTQNNILLNYALLQNKIAVEDYNNVLFSHNPMLNQQNKINQNFNNFDFKNDTAYQIDTGLLKNFLREKYCIPKGLKHIDSKVIGTTYFEDGGLKSITLSNGNVLEGDLFIDCSGFASILLEKTMESTFIPFNTLINDKTIATKIPYSDIENEMETSTNATTLSCGWVWNIPLWSRVGSGYVYSSKFTTPEQAEVEFKNYLTKERTPVVDEKILEKLEFKHIHIKNGYHQKAMIKNVVGIGLSYGFIEPLESTGLLITGEQISALLHMLTQPNKKLKYSSIDRTILNKSFEEQILYWKQLIEYHFAFAQRDDTPYWKYVTEEIEYDIEPNVYDVLKWSNPVNDTLIFNDSLKLDDVSREIILTNFKGGLISEYLWKNIENNLNKEEKIDFMSQLNTNIHTCKALNKTLDNQKLETQYQFLKRTIFNV